MVIDTVIIGGGFAGLSAAVQLAKTGVKPLLLEQKSHLGGRVYSIEDRETGDVIDNGQHIIMGCYHRTIEFMRLVGTSEAVRFQPRLRVIYRGANGFHDTLDCPALPGPLHLLTALSRMKSLSWSDKLAALRYGLNMRRKGPADGETVHQFSARMRQPLALRQRLWDPIALSALNEETASADGGLLKRVLNDGFMGKARDSRIGLPVLPLSRMHGDKAAEYIRSKGGDVRLNAKVKTFDWDQQRLKAAVLADGERIAAGSFISAMPPKPLRTILEASGLETMIRPPDLGESPILSVYLWFDQSISEDDFCCLQDCWFEWAFHRHNFMEPGEHSKPCVCLVASAARRMQGLSREIIVQRAIDDLRKAYGGSVPTEPAAASVFWETAATFSCTPENNAKRPGAKTALANFFFAGDWIQTGLPATIEGAVRSGETAAKALLDYRAMKASKKY